MINLLRSKVTRESFIHGMVIILRCFDFFFGYVMLRTMILIANSTWRTSPTTSTEVLRPTVAVCPPQGRRIVVIQPGLARAINDFGGEALKYFEQIASEVGVIDLVDPEAQRCETQRHEGVLTRLHFVRTPRMSRKWFPNTWTSLTTLRTVRYITCCFNDRPNVFWTMTHNYAAVVAFLSSERISSSKTLVEIRGNYQLLFDLHRESPLFHIASFSTRLQDLAFQSSQKMISKCLSNANAVVGRNGNNLNHAIEWGADSNKTSLIRIEINAAYLDAQEGDFAGCEECNLLLSGVSGSHLPRREDSQPVDSDIHSVAPLGIFVGRVSRQKFVREVIDAWAQVVEWIPSAHLLVVGSGPELSSIIDRVRDKGLTSNFTFAGSQQPVHVSHLIQASSVGIEAYGGASLAEKALLGLPVVAFDIEWHQELLQDVPGALVPFLDVELMSQAIVSLLTDPQLSRRNSTALRKSADEMFRSTDRLTKEVEVLQSLTSRP